MMTDGAWRSTVGFADRLAVVDKMATLMAKADPQLLPPEAMRHAHKEETRFMTQAHSKSSYVELWTARLRELQAIAKSPTESSEEYGTLEEFPGNGPAQTIGPYKMALPFASGVFSTVYKAFPNAQTPGSKRSLIALKVTSTSVSRPPHDSKREARLLAIAGRDHHDHIIPLFESFPLPPSTFVLVLPFLPFTLASLLESGLDAERLPSIIHDILSGLAHLHSLGILHRDIKPSNILFAIPTGSAQIADLGIAWYADDRTSEPWDEKITDVGTTCYRAPELLFGYRSYGQGLDMWALGCVLAECLHPEHEPFFDAGDLGSELQLVASIFQKLGTPDSKTWPESAKFPDYGKITFYDRPARSWEEIMPYASEEARKLTGRLLVYESGTRISAKEALKHPYFSGIEN